MTIKTGRYYIANVMYKNRVFIPDHNVGTPLQASCGEDLPGEQWTVKLLPNKQYSIENIGEHTCFAYGRASTSDNSVTGRSNRRLWIIEETSVQGNYRIGLDGMTSVWALIDAEDGTPVTLDSAIANPRTWWTFKAVEEVVDSPPATSQIALFELPSLPSSLALPLRLDFLIIQEMPSDSIPNVSGAIDEVCRPLTAELQTQAPRANLIQFKSFGSNKIRFQRFSGFITSEELLNIKGSDWTPCRGHVASWLKDVMSDFRDEAMKVAVLNLNAISFWNDSGIIVDLISSLVEQGIHMILTLSQPTLGENLYGTGIFEKLDHLSSNLLHLEKGGFSGYIGDYIATASRLMEPKRPAEGRRPGKEGITEEKHLAQQICPIESGRYIITNVRFQKSACIEDPNNGTPLVSSDGRDPFNRELQWEVVRLRNGRYSIQNVNHGSFANGGNRAIRGDNVEGRHRMQMWIIKETCFSGIYTIGSSDTTMFWALADDGNGTSFHLDDVDTNSWAWWTFTTSLKEAAAVDNAIHVDATRWAEKRLAQQTQPIESGRYIITHARYKDSIAHLEDPNNGTPVTSMYGGDTPSALLQWEVTRLNNGRYSIQNVNHGNFANVGTHAHVGDTVEGITSMQMWTIQETRSRGQYTIGCSRNTLFWELWDGEDGTLVNLGNKNANSRAWWTFATSIKEAVATENAIHAEVTRSARKCLAEQTGPIESGRYIIINVATNNVAFISDPNHATPVAASYGQGIPDEEWKVKRLNNGRYSIQNVSHKAFANVGRNALGETVEGRRSMQLWAIQETRSRGKYTIGCSSDTLFWALPDDEYETPVSRVPHVLLAIEPTMGKVTLDGEVNNQRTWWTFTPLLEEEAVAVDNFIHAEVTCLAEKRLAEQTGPVQSSRYIITNVATKNLAFLPSLKDGTPLMASYGREMLSEQWDVTRLNDGHHLIANVSHNTCFPNAQIGASLDNKVVGSSSRQKWTIQETCVRGQYTIGCSNNTLLWTFINDENKTPVTLDGTIDNIRTWWTFTPLLKESIDMENARHAELMRLAEEHLSEQPGCIKSGRYIIINAQHKMTIVLSDPNNGTPLRTNYGRELLSEQWEVTRLNNGRYLIANVCHNSSFANGARFGGGRVQGGSGMQTWVINETRARGQYMIGSSDTKMFWTLLDGEHEGEAVILRDGRGDARAWWIFNEVKGV